MAALAKARIPCRSPSGIIVAHIEITPERDAITAASAPLIEIQPLDAKEHGETIIQLRESETYEYEVQGPPGYDLRLLCSLARRRRNLAPGQPDAGRLDTSCWCGTLLLELVNEGSTQPVGTALLDVRSVKLDYRTQYRGMLRRIADELADLVIDARSSAKLTFRSSFEERRDVGWMQIQVELLREILESAEFTAALQRIVMFPHERLTVENRTVRTDRPIKWTSAASQQLITRYPRRNLPAAHPLQKLSRLTSIAEQITFGEKKRDLDTVENRFVKFALQDFRAFISRYQQAVEMEKGWQPLIAVCQKLLAILDETLGRALFQSVGEFRYVPLGSPVLQRKGGYRELLRWWLRFRTAAELSWEGGEDLFHAGQRDVARLYEYWLFFELIAWFYRRCGTKARPPVDELVEGLDGLRPNLRLKQRIQLGPFVGEFATASRRLNARFAYNRSFDVSDDRAQSGSWTRRLHPDYTFTFWPEGVTEAEAERLELLVHVHFDAKYRVENIDGLFGSKDADDADDDQAGNYKRQDLLKMHAYRDAIKRSHGAYVLYPGRGNHTFRGFYHEILPGLGAFAIAPDDTGQAQGMAALEHFLDDVLMHLANRTTASERISYHVSEAYRVSEPPVDYGAVQLAEKDPAGDEYRALPPAEAMVLVAWYNTPEQLRIAEDMNGLVYVRLGRRAGGLHVHPNISRVRYVLLHTSGGIVAPGLLALREPGFRVYTRTELRRELQRRAGALGVAAWQGDANDEGEDFIYALFRCRPDSRFRTQRWNEEEVMNLVEAFESDARNTLVRNLARTSPYPRILPLRDVLKTRCGETDIAR